MSAFNLYFNLFQIVKMVCFQMLRGANTDSRMQESALLRQSRVCAISSAVEVAAETQRNCFALHCCTVALCAVALHCIALCELLQFALQWVVHCCIVQCSSLHCNCIVLAESPTKRQIQLNVTCISPE